MKHHMPTSTRACTRPPIAAIAAIVLSFMTVGPSAAETTEYWYRVALGGQPAGWMVARDIEREGQRITESDSRLALSRGGAAIRFEMASRFVENADGEPVQAWTRQLLGQTPTETTYDFLPDGVRSTTKQGDDTKTARLPGPEGEWLTPLGAQEAIRNHLKAGDTSFTIRSLDPQLGVNLVETQWKRVLEHLPQTVRKGGKTYVTTRWTQSMSFAPGLVTEADLDADGLLIKSVTPFMGIDMTLELTDRETALTKAGAPELLVQSFIYPDRTLDRPRATSRAVYRVRRRDGAAIALPSVGAQRAKPGAKSSDGVVVTVSLGDRQPADKAIDDAQFLRATTFLDHADPGVQALLKQALAQVPPDSTTAQRAEALRAFVAGHLTSKNLNSLLATATEVAETGSGDCTEHSMLLTALLRAAKIPARVVTGLIYVDQFVGASKIFGYHMWSQALIGGTWIDLDATLDRAFDAAHIAFATSAFDDDASALIDMAGIVPLMGEIEIDVIDLTHGDTTP